MRRFLVVTVGAVAVLAGCQRSPATSPWAPVPSSAVIYSDNSLVIQDSLRMVVRDRGALQALWDRLALAGDPPPAPTVDFDREMLLVVGAGRMTPEDRIQIDSVVIHKTMTESGRREEVLEAVVRTVEGCRRFRSDAYPIQIVRVRRYPGAVQFVERHETVQDC